MNHLPEILRVIADLRVPKIEIIDEARDKTTNDNIAKLYFGFKSGKFASDQVAAHEVYRVAQTDTKYTTLKARLKRRLVNSLFHLDLSRKNYSEATKAQYGASKNLFVVKTLLALGARSSAMNIAQRTLETTSQYQLTSIECELLLLLRTHTSLRGNLKLYEQYDSLFKRAMRRLNSEAMSWEYYERVSLEFGRSEEIRDELAVQVKGWLDSLESYRDADSTFTFMVNYFRVKYLYYTYCRDVRMMLLACEEAIEYVRSNSKLGYTIRLGEFTLWELYCYVILRDYEKGLKSLERCVQYFPKGTNNWFVYNENAFLLFMQTEKFIQAEGVYNEITSHPRFSTLTEQRKEKWKIYELFLRYALHSRPLLTSGSTGEQHSLPRIKTFLRSVPIYTQDKRGLNISILILQILYLLELEDFNGIIDRMEALRTYRMRYLRASSNPHAALFFKLLQIMENNSFSYKLTKEKSKKYFEELSRIVADGSDMGESVQILPYDWLWENILRKLKSVEEHRKAISASSAAAA